VADLCVAHQTIEDLKIRVGSLEKDVAGSKATKEIAPNWLQKAIDVNEGLWKEIEVEKSSRQALSVHIDLLNKRLEEARVAGVLPLSYIRQLWLVLAVQLHLCQPMPLLMAYLPSLRKIFLSYQSLSEALWILVCFPVPQISARPSES
jgi:hypothetical protein